MDSAALTGGFSDAPIDAANAFRVIMGVMARPGSMGTLSGSVPPLPLSTAAGVTILTLCDPDTPIALASSHDTAQIRDWITFHTGSPIVDTSIARFAVGPWDLLRTSAFHIGKPEYPDRSATLIVECGSISQSGATLRGPGIQDTAQLSLPELDAFQKNAELFPLGLDYFFTHGSQIAALPRTTKVT
jgi:alpha-D-ribose 1-methylphosphonate 5-triphosphate synthase subunit PhnH